MSVKCISWFQLWKNKTIIIVLKYNNLGAERISGLICFRYSERSGKAWVGDKREKKGRVLGCGNSLSKGPEAGRKAFSALGKLNGRQGSWVLASRGEGH